MSEISPQLKKIYEQTLGLLLEGRFEGKYSPVVCEVFSYYQDQLKESEVENSNDAENNAK